MKKILLSFAVTIVMIFTASAQDVTSEPDYWLPGFSWGPRIGFNISNMSLPSDDAKVGFTTGVFTNYRFTRLFSLSADVMYSREGAKWSRIMSGREGEYDVTGKLNFINVPVLANFCVAPGLNLKTGIQPGFLVGAKYKYKANDRSETLNVKDDYKTMDVSIPIGVSYELPWVFGIILDARYNIGITNIAKEGESVRNNYFSFTAGFRF